MTERNRGGPSPAVADEPGAPVQQPSPAGNASILGGVPAFGSDVVAITLRDLGIEYVTLNPGASFRGLHDSLVNFLGDADPSMMICLHEEHAVAIAHGYAKVTGRPMAAIVHSNVGLMHASMGIFNAWCDRVPVVVLGATGPVDAAKRRPWIDWIHTAQDQGALVRPFVKWDAQPASSTAAREALARGYWLANAIPKAPVYVNLDVSMQEAPADAGHPMPDLRRYLPPLSDAASPTAVEEVRAMLASSKATVFLFGRHSRSQAGWEQRVALAEHYAADVVTDPQRAGAFPTLHPRHAGATAFIPDERMSAMLRSAEVIVSFDWVDLGGLLHAVTGGSAPVGHVVHVSLDHTLHNGWSMDHQAFPPVDKLIPSEPDSFVLKLWDACGSTAPQFDPARPLQPVQAAAPQKPPTIEDLARHLRRAVADRPCSLLHTTIAWSEWWWPLSGPLDWLGGPGGAGLGAGPGIAVGAALGLRGTGRLPVAVLGDGDFLMGATAIWTAVRYRVPLLVAIANNRSYYNDEIHQERVALHRGRPTGNKWVGQRIDTPSIDFVKLAEAQGAIGIGPVSEAGALDSAFAEAVTAVENGGVAVVDVRVLPGYF